MTAGWCEKPLLAISAGHPDYDENDDPWEQGGNAKGFGVESWGDLWEGTIEEEERRREK